MPRTLNVQKLLGDLARALRQRAEKTRARLEGKLERAKLDEELADHLSTYAGAAALALGATAVVAKAAKRAGFTKSGKPDMRRKEHRKPRGSRKIKVRRKKRL